MKRRLLFLSFIICLLPLSPARAQYDIIPLPDLISIDAKGRTLPVDAYTTVQEKLNP